MSSVDPLDPERVQRLLTEKEISEECPSCRHVEGRLAFALLERSDPSGLPVVGVPGVSPTTRLFTITCGYCGFVRLFDADRLGV